MVLPNLSILLLEKPRHSPNVNRSERRHKRNEHDLPRRKMTRSRLRLMHEQNQSMMLGMLLFEKLEVYHHLLSRQRSLKARVRVRDLDKVQEDDKFPMDLMDKDKDKDRTDQHEEAGRIRTKLKRLKMDSK